MSSETAEAIASPEAAPPGDVSSFMSHRQILVVFGSLALGLLLASLDQTIVSTAMLTIIGDIGVKNGLAHMPWIATAYVLASTASTPIYGKLSDLFGRKPLYMSAILLPGRLRPERVLAEPRRADRLPHRAGPRRRRHHGPDVRHHRRRRPAP